MATRLNKDNRDEYVEFLTANNWDTHAAARHFSVQRDTILNHVRKARAYGDPRVPRRLTPPGGYRKTKDPIKNDNGHTATRNTLEEIHAARVAAVNFVIRNARITGADHATSVDNCATLLDMIGLKEIT